MDLNISWGEGRKGTIIYPSFSAHSGSEDIFNGNLKLILGLIWTLIRRYQIRSTGRALSTKDSLLAWVNTQIPEQKIKNFTKDWNSGIALCALVNRIGSGVIPHYATLSPSDRTKNCALGMDHAEEKLGIPKIMEPNDLCHPDIDELSVMTYISYFCTPANDHLLKWVQATIPDRGITNFTTDWNDGTNLACLLEALNPGGFPDSRELDPHNSLDNLTKGMKLADEQLAIKPVIKPNEMADPKVDELNIVTYLSRFQNAKPLQAIFCSGEGLESAIVGKTAVFEVDTSKGGSGDLAVKIHCSGKPVVANITQKSNKTEYVIEYVPESASNISIAIEWSGEEIPTSPYSITVLDPKSFSLTGPQISGNEYAKVGDVVKMELKGMTQISDVRVSIELSSGQTEQAEIISSSETTAEYSYIPHRVGRDKVIASIADVPIPGSPFEVRIIDPSIIDSEKVTWSCEELEESDTIKQGELIEITVDGSEGGETTPTIVATGGAETKEYTSKIANNHDGTFTVSLSPWHIGKNEIQILWGGNSIPETPISFEVVKSIEASDITAAGSGLKQAFVDSETSVVINAIESGLVEQGILDAAFECGEDEDEEDIPLIEITDEGEGMYNLSLLPVREGTFALHITYDNQHISNSPFTIEVLGAPNSGKCKVFGEAMEKKPAFFALNKPIKFSVDTSEAGSGNINISAVQPNGISVKVNTINEDDLYHLKLDPTEVGHYQVKVKWDGEAVPGSPFDFNAVDPRMCKVEGLPQSGDTLQLDETINFSVLTEEVGECTPVVSFNIQGEIDVLEATEQSDGVFSYNFMLSCYGKVLVYVKIAGVDVPNSPFSFFVEDPYMFSIAAVDLNSGGKYALVSETVKIKISGSGSSSELLVTAHGPSADLNLKVNEKDTGNHEVNFVPIEPGTYEVFVECAGRHINGSPFTVKVADPSKVQLLGGGLSSIQQGESGEITVKTRGAGEGTLEASVVTDYDSDVSIFTEIKDLGLDTYTLILNGKKIGNGNIHLKWAGFPVPNTPFLTHVCDASRCVASGEFEALTSKKGKAGKLISFTVDTENAGEGKLEVTAKGPSAQYTMNVVKNEESSKYKVSFTPWEIGEHTIEAQWGSGNIPGSPFLINVGSPLEMETCNATGNGLNHGIAEKKATFAIICSEVGLLEKNLLKVTIKGESAHADVTLTDNNNGCYTVDYIPPIPGAYLATILYDEKHIPGSPFKVTVDTTPDPTKCKAYGPALHPNALAIAGSPLEFFVDTSEAGKGKLRVYIKGPNDYKPRLFLADDDKGVYSVKFDAMKAGKYIVVVAWAESHIPNSPFRLKVHPAADASKVRAFGPGLLDGFIGTPGQFTIETKNAGIGTLLLRIHGLKNSFKIDSVPLASEDPRTLITTYNPKLVGEYVIFLRWSGVHVPGSPFTVKIKQKPGELLLHSYLAP